MPVARWTAESGVGKIPGTALGRSIDARLDHGKHLVTGPVIDRINALSRGDFCEAFGPLYARAWVAEAAETARPYRYEADLLIALRRAMDRADEARRRDLVRAYPELADMELADAIRQVHGVARLRLADVMAQLAARDAEDGDVD